MTIAIDNPFQISKPMMNLKCTIAIDNPSKISKPMKNLRGHIRLNPLADPSQLTDPAPWAHLLGSVTCGSSEPGALALLPHPCTDYDATPYPFTLVHVRHGIRNRLPMRRTLAALCALGYSIQGDVFVHL